jgi:tetratricopeptide (TPR) repeat protein
MLSEEGLIVIFGLIACGALILGAMELKWPSRSTRPPVGRRVRRRTRLRDFDGPPAEHYVRRSPVPVPSASVSDAQQVSAVVAAPPSGDRASGAAAPSTLDTCFELYQERRFAEVIAFGTATLQRDPAAPAHERAALWSVVALARQASGDDAGARAALESAIQAAPASQRITYQRQLVSLALQAAQGALTGAANHPDSGSEERVVTIRKAVAWLEGGRAVMDGEQALHDLRESAHALLWPAYEQVVIALVQRQEFGAARRHLREALDDPAFPPARADRFRELLSGTFSGEIGQLTAQAIRSMQDARESEALGSLNRAQTLLATIAAEALPPKRREEVDQRLWWGYNKLGVRRLDAGAFDDALEPLLHAVRFQGVGPDRQGETRAALARALAGIVDVRAVAVRQLADEGDREAAMVETDRLWSLIASATAAGVTEEQLSTVIGKIRRVVDSVR